MSLSRSQRKRNRLKGYDYSQVGWYFVTICVRDRIECLGKIKNNQMEYGRYGGIVLKYWQTIPNHYQNAFLDEWIIMPNHIHGIIVIIDDSVGTGQCPVPTNNFFVPTGNTNTNIRYGLLSKIIKSFKEISKIF